MSNCQQCGAWCSELGCDCTTLVGQRRLCPDCVGDVLGNLLADLRSQAERAVRTLRFARSGLLDLRGHYSATSSNGRDLDRIAGQIDAAIELLDPPPSAPPAPSGLRSAALRYAEQSQRPTPEDAP